MFGGTGRRKIEIKKVENISDVRATFSRRRKGLFKKATKLHTATGAQVAVLVFSPAGPPFILGEPDFDSIIAQFLAKYDSSNTSNPSTRIIPVKLNNNVDDMISDDDDEDDDSDRDREVDGDKVTMNVRDLWLKTVRVEEYTEEDELMWLKKELEKCTREIIQEIEYELVD